MSKKAYTSLKHKKNHQTIPPRHLLGMLIILAEVIGVFTGVLVLAIYFTWVWYIIGAIHILLFLLILSSSDNPDYKIPWIVFILLVPILGPLCYILFYSRKLSKKQTKKLKLLKNTRIPFNQSYHYEKLKEDNPLIYSDAKYLTHAEKTNLHRNTAIKYYHLGDDIFPDLLKDINNAKEFIFLDYYIIREGVFFDTILDALIKKSKEGVEVRLLYDDIGCMRNLPGNYDKYLESLGIHTRQFNRLKYQPNSEFNNRSHRKVTVIDGLYGYTGGFNLADEYVNKIVKFGHWKDSGIRVEGELVDEFTRQFLCDYELSSPKQIDFNFEKYYRKHLVPDDGYCISFTDGPRPIYPRETAKGAILNLLNHATKNVYITTPYLITDNDVMTAIETTSLRGIDVRIITPHIPDKKLIFKMTQSSYKRLMEAGVKIYEYTPGFIHTKSYQADGQVAIIGTINLDYRSLVHNFENGVWMYNHEVIKDIEKDFLETQKISMRIEKKDVKDNIIWRFFRGIVKIFAPLM